MEIKNSENRKMNGWYRTEKRMEIEKKEKLLRNSLEIYIQEIKIMY
jgi:hypothetical protein